MSAAGAADPHAAPAAVEATPAADDGAGPAAARRLLVGLIGAGIQRSLSPALHEAEARAQGLALHYQLIDLARAGRDAGALPGLIDAARTIGFAGLNITYPCKQAVLPLLDELSDEARTIGAVNTVVFRDGRAVGHNTDGAGWAWGFRRTLPQADRSCVVLLGAGGAGAAVAHALLGLGAGELRVVDRDHARAQQLVEALRRRAAGMPLRAGNDIAAALRGASGLIHATPTGMDAQPGLPLPAALLHAGLWLSEVVYVPLQTPLLRAARAAGCAVCDGGTMAVGQAVGAFALFTGRQADAERMRQHFEQLASARHGR